MRSFRTLLMGFCLSVMSWPALAYDTLSHASRWVMAVAGPVPTAATLSADTGLFLASPVLALHYDIRLTSDKSPGDVIAERLSGFTATSYDPDPFDGCRDAIHRSEVRPGTIAGIVAAGLAGSHTS